MSTPSAEKYPQTDLRSLNPDTPAREFDWEQDAAVEFTPIMDQEIQKFSWVWDRVLAVGGTSVLAGKPKSGKTTLAYHLMFAIATGKKFLGRDTSKGKVLFAKLEGDPNMARQVMRKLSGGKSYPIFMTAFRAVTETNGIAQLKDAIERHQPSFVVVDTLWRLLRIKDLNEYSQGAHGVEAIEELAKTCECHICLIHHERKEASHGASGVLGSTSIIGGVDTIMVLRKHGEDRILESEQRYGDSIDNLSIGIVNGQYQIVEFARGMKASILTMLEKNHKGLSTQELIEAVGCRKGTMSKALNDMKYHGAIVRKGAGKPNDPYVWAATPETMETKHGK